MNLSAPLIEAHIFRKKGNDIEFLMLKRAEKEIYPGFWQMVTGALKDENEKAYRTALREIMEETGLTPIQFWVVPHINSFYWVEKDSICQIPVFAALVESDSKVIISDEHSDFKWVDKNEAVELLAWKGQRESVEIVYEYFVHQQNFLKFVEIPLRDKKN